MYKRGRSRGHKRTFGRAGISRARFLRLIGTGAGLSLLSLSSTILGARPGIAQAQPGILSGGEFPIGVWWPPPPGETKVGRYAQIAGANFNFVISGNAVNNTLENNAQALDASEANGLRFLLTDGSPETRGSLQYLIKRQANDSKLRARIGDIFERLADGDNPALAGINLYDEPHTDLFERLRYARSEIQRRDGTLLPYVNAYPSYASTRALGTDTYAKYLQALRAKVESPLLSFDHYPLLAKGITSDYFYNWAVIRKYSRQAPAVPSWGFIQSVGFDGSKVGLKRRRKPTEAEIRWQVNVALAYGAKGLVYFTYWTPTDATIKFGNALISRSGAKTELYGYATRVNGYLKKVGRELLPLISESVVHAREKRLPRGATQFKADAYVKSVGGSPVILSRFRRSSTVADRYLLVANRSSAKVSKTRLSFSGTVKRVFEFDPKTLKYSRVRLKNDPRPRTLTRSIQPGAARLLWLRGT